MWLVTKGKKSAFFNWGRVCVGYKPYSRESLMFGSNWLTQNRLYVLFYLFCVICLFSLACFGFLLLCFEERQKKNINLIRGCLGGFGRRKVHYTKKKKLKTHRNSSLGETKLICKKKKNREVSVLSERILIEMQAI